MAVNYAIFFLPKITINFCKSTDQKYDQKQILRFRNKMKFYHTFEIYEDVTTQVTFYGIRIIVFNR